MPPLEMSFKVMNHIYAPYPVMARNDPPTKSRSPWSANAYSYFPFGAPAEQPTMIAPPQEENEEEEFNGPLVQFASHVAVHQVMHFKDYTPEEAKTTWYNKAELRDMRRKCKEQASQVTASDYEKDQMSAQQGPLNDVSNNYHYEGFESTVRGLENRTEMGALRKKRHRLQAWMAVFSEQRWQNEQGYSDPETLADVYFEVSEPCHVVASMVGLRDAREVESMDQQETKEELEKENQRGIWTSESSGELDVVHRRYQRLMVLQDRDHNQHLMVSSAA